MVRFYNQWVQGGYCPQHLYITHVLIISPASTLSRSMRAHFRCLPSVVESMLCAQWFEVCLCVVLCIDSNSYQLSCPCSLASQSASLVYRVSLVCIPPRPALLLGKKIAVLGVVDLFVVP